MAVVKVIFVGLWVILLARSSRSQNVNQTRILFPNLVSTPSGSIKVEIGLRPAQDGCFYWCRKKLLHSTAYQYFCCDDAYAIFDLFKKPGFCPPRRPRCPDVRLHSGPPVLCKFDFSCPQAQKCCYDVCIEGYVCKPPVPSN